MARSVEDIKNEIRALTPEERRELLASLIREMDGAAPDPNLEKLWLAEAQRRYRELVDGTVESVTAHVVFERLRSRLAG
jgi:hypothetical protein